MYPANRPVVRMQRVFDVKITAIRNRLQYYFGGQINYFNGLVYITYNVMCRFIGCL